MESNKYKLSERRQRILEVMLTSKHSVDFKNRQFHVGNSFVLMYNDVLSLMFTLVTAVKQKKNICS